MRKSNDTYVAGQYNVICDVCGWKFKSSELRPGIGRQKGLRVCARDWDEPHPQDKLRVRPDNQTVPWTRPEPTDVFIEACTYEGMQGVAGQGVAGCAVAGLDSDLASEDSDRDLAQSTFYSNNATL